MNRKEKDKLAILLNRAYKVQNIYGKSPSELGDVVEFFLYVFEDYKYDIIEKSFKEFFKHSSNFPTPHDIIKLYEIEIEKINRKEILRVESERKYNREEKRRLQMKECEWNNIIDFIIKYISENSVSDMNINYFKENIFFDSFIDRCLSIGVENRYILNEIEMLGVANEISSKFKKVHTARFSVLYNKRKYENLECKRDIKERKS